MHGFFPNMIWNGLAPLDSLTAILIAHRTWGSVATQSVWRLSPSSSCICFMISGFGELIASEIVVTSWVLRCELNFAFDVNGLLHSWHVNLCGCASSSSRNFVFTFFFRSLWTLSTKLARALVAVGCLRRMPSSSQKSVNSLLMKDEWLSANIICGTPYRAKISVDNFWMVTDDFVDGTGKISIHPENRSLRVRR